jgi:DNA-binding protein HU-beta
VIARAADMPAGAAGRLAGEVVAAIRAEIVETGRFSLPDFGAFTVRETPRRTALNPRTGEKVDVKAGAAVRFKASPARRRATRSRSTCRPAGATGRPAWRRCATRPAGASSGSWAARGT